MPYKDPEQRRAYARAWMAARRAEWFAGKICVDCDTSSSLELDHVDASTKIDHRIWSWSAARREAELAKCVARCTECHKIKTDRENEHARGEQSGSAKLTELQVRYIKESSLGHRPIAREVGISEYVVRQIRKGTIWKHID
jgi:hypothetical protein